MSFLYTGQVFYKKNVLKDALNNSILHILNQHFSGKPLSEEQEQTLQQWEEASAHNKNVWQSLHDSRFLQHTIQQWDDYTGSEEATWQKLSQQLFNKNEVSPVPVHRISLLRRWWAAASVILLMGIGAYLWKANEKNGQSSSIVEPTVDIAPGRQGAILILADGSQVELDSLGNGVIATQNGSQATIKNGELVYDVTGSASNEAVYNTMMTPKGRQFSLLLPDGTRVWLNAASSIRYPTVFAGKERQVHLTGEGYFEVAKNAKMPFRLNVSNKATVEVLGTHFNVNAYENEGTINTTLLEGSVKINGALLRPGQQAQIRNQHGGRKSQQGIYDATAKGGVRVISNADIEKVMAWKNGIFDFQGVKLKEAMRQLERWYDIEVIYEKGVKDIELIGGMTRDVPLGGLLAGFKELGVHCKLEGRKLIILP